MTRPTNDQTGDSFHCHPEDTSPDRGTLDAIFQAGVAARRDGLPSSQNPHAAGTEERQEWSAGWSATVEIDEEDSGIDASC